MQRLLIDFAQRRPQDRLLAASPASLSGIALGLLLIVGALMRWQQLPAPAMPITPPPVQHAAPVAKPTAAEIAAINRAVLQLNLPWPELFNALEAATPASVALLELTPDAAGLRLTGKAETSDSSAMLAYLARLQRQPFFNQVLLLRHERQTEPGPRPIRFVFEARWGEAD